MAKVELKKIGKVYEGNVRAVSDANITIKDKEFVVLVGPSGCGKTTTLRMVAGLEDISEGELLIDGKLVNDVPPKDRDIAMVFQNYALYPHMSVYDNMAFGLKIRKLPKEEIDQRVKEAARILDIEKLLDRKPKQLSGGQRQRVAMGRALMLDPKLLLLDEPTAGLSPKYMEQIFQITRDVRDAGVSILLVEQHAKQALAFCDRGYVLATGANRHEGTGQALLADREVAEMFLGG